jgi:hypothetical protein
VNQVPQIRFHPRRQHQISPTHWLEVGTVGASGLSERPLEISLLDSAVLRRRKSSRLIY